jgi:hypothetical protein
LAKFFPIGWLFILGTFLKIQIQSKSLGFFFHGNRYVLNLQKCGGATFWVVFLTKLIWSPWSEEEIDFHFSLSVKAGQTE